MESASDGTGRIKVAAAQTASVFLDRAASVEKACRVIAEAAAEGASLVVFPEGFIPAHPAWYHFHLPGSDTAKRLSLRLFENAMEIPSDDAHRLCEAARRHRIVVVMGICEKAPATDGTMYNTQLVIDQDGTICGKHRKLTPTTIEKLLHAPGFGDTFGSVPTAVGRVSSLICGENSNPLAVFALAAEYTRVHAMSWPPHRGVDLGPQVERVAVASQAFATMARCFVVSAAGVCDDTLIDSYRVDTQGELFLRSAAASGGSIIVAPGGRILAGPAGAGEQILYADIELDETVKAKLGQDYAGNYNRPDVFQLSVNRAAPMIINDVNEDTHVRRDDDGEQSGMT